MLRASYRNCDRLRFLKNAAKCFSTEHKIPERADVVVLGGGSIGCNTLYQLSKRGIKAVLLEQHKITCGTSWHTSGLFWRLRPSDTDIKLLATTREILTNLENETGINPGWINNGGLFIASTEERVKEYKRLQTLGHVFGVESQWLSPQEAAQLSPILNPKSFLGALYSPGDGAMDPSMYCTALLKGATARGCQVIEHCPATQIIIDHSSGVRKIKGVETPLGVIKTNCIVNACGVWARNVARMVGLDVPIAVFKHSYVITESLPQVKGSPNIRDHDRGIYYRVQGESLHLGGYEKNPILVKEVAPDFNFALYDLDYSVFQTHLDGAKELTPVIETTGIKKDICGPESFTPDHRPIIGEDPRLDGFFHACGFNSSGMMLSAGCADQLALWISQGRPEFQMFEYDVRRFSPSVTADRALVTEQSFESYGKNYAIVFPHDQPLAGRNHKIDVFHEALVAKGAVMEYCQGWERPGYYIENATAPVRGFDWYGYYDHVRNTDRRYEKQLEGDRTFGFSKHHDLIGEEALAARNNVAVFNLSYFAKMYLTGPDSKEAADWLFTANVDRVPDRVIYTCALNAKGGIEADVRVIKLQQGLGTLVGPVLKGTGFYIAAGGSSGYQTMCHLKKELRKKNFKSVITDITERLGILSIQGPKSGELMQSMTEYPITDEKLPAGMSHIITINGHKCRIIRISMIGELGYELHIPVASCIPIYNKLVEAGRGFDMRHAGFRALFSLGCEKGHHLYNRDMRIDDNPVEANLEQLCRKEGSYLGKQHVEKMKQHGVKKQRVFFTLEDHVPLHGYETIWRDDAVVGYLRRGEYGYSLDSSIGIGYVEHPKRDILKGDFLTSGSYEIEVMGKKYPATLYLKSPFDPTHQRVYGRYEHQFQEQTHFED